MKVQTASGMGKEPQRAHVRYVRDEIVPETS